MVMDETVKILKQHAKENRAFVVLSITKVEVSLRPEDLPGSPREVVVSAKCGEAIYDRRQVSNNEMVLCKPCQQGCTYYTVLG